MLPATFHGYNPNNYERVVRVYVEPSLDRSQHLIRVERGKSKATLRQTELLGPYPEDEIPERFQAAVQGLHDEGYQDGGLDALIAALSSSNAGERARAALRLGWRRQKEAVEPLLVRLQQDAPTACSVLDALGAIGDERAIGPIRQEIDSDPPARRRSAVEALRQLHDSEGMERARDLALQRLPAPVRQVLQQETLQMSAAANALIRSMKDLQMAQLGPVLDGLYDLGTPVAVSVTRQILQQLKFNQPHIARAVKSIFKRAELRHDYVTLGWLSHTIQTQTGSKHVQGPKGPIPICGKKTREHLRRRTWRYLVDLARYRPARFSALAAEVLIHHQAGQGHGYLAWRLLGLWLSQQKKLPAANVRWEKFADLWDAEPRPLLRVLSAAKSPEVQRFALSTVRGRHSLLIRSATHSEILAMLQVPYDPTVQLALQELERRFDPNKPDWDLLRQMLDDPRPTARQLGQRWLKMTAHLWLPSVDRIIDFLGLEQPNLRAQVTEMVIAYLHGQPDLRRQLTERVVLILRLPESAAEIQAGYAAVAREGLADEIRQTVPVLELAAWIANSAPVVKEVAGELLRQRPEAVTELGLERLTLLAQHEVASVRAAAQALIRSALHLLREDPSLLYVLVESDWTDTRSFAFDLLRQRLDIAALGLDGLIGLLDSNRTDVQQLGEELTRRHLDQLPAGDLVLRLIQHPDPRLRSFALELAIQHLPTGAHSLVQLRGFCRSALFDTWPERKVKDVTIALLEGRGVEDREQAEVAISILGDVIRTQTRDDFERALQALVRLQMAWPDLPSTVKLVGDGVV